MRTFNFILNYTIKDDDLRNELRDTIINTLEGKAIDESSYLIKQRDIQRDIKFIYKTISPIITRYKKIVDNNDFINLYYPKYSICKVRLWGSLLGTCIAECPILKDGVMQSSIINTII